MADTKKNEQQDKLKKLKEKTADPKIKSSIDEKLKGLNQPFTK